MHFSCITSSDGEILVLGWYYWKKRQVSVSEKIQHLVCIHLDSNYVTEIRKEFDELKFHNGNVIYLWRWRLHMRHFHGIVLIFLPGAIGSILKDFDFVICFVCGTIAGFEFWHT